MTGGSNNPPTQTTQQVLSPQQQELMNLAMPGIQQFAASTPTRYQGNTVAPFTAPQVAGQNMALDAAGAQGTLANTGSAFTNNVLSTTPDAQEDAAIDAATRPISQQLQDTTLPAIRQSAVTTGGFGGSRQGIAEGIAGRGAAQATGDTAAKVAESVYDTNVNNQLKALGLLPQTQQSLLSPATTTSAVGDVQQQQNQAGINQDVSNYNFDQYAPFLQSQEILSLLNGLPGGGTVSTGSTANPNTATTALGGAASGAMLGSMLMPGVGTVAGAGAGALLPFLFH